MAECPDPSATETINSATSKKLHASDISSNLLIRIENLVNCYSVERQRLEFKKSWNKGPTRIQIVKTISAFANDYYNDNGGYIVIGIAEEDSDEADRQIHLPPSGIEANAIERIQKEIVGACKSLIRPAYTPILSPEVLEGKHVLVIWAQASDNRPHTAKESDKGEYRYFIRKGPETTRANEEEVKILLQSSQKIPFDDRMARSESGKRIHQDAIGRQLVLAFLDDVCSNMEKSKDRSTLQKLNLVYRCGDEERDGQLKAVYTPKNVALLMFNRVPHFYFPGAKIEVTQFTRQNVVIFDSEQVITGPLPNQIRKCIDYVISSTNKQKSVRLETYPYQALREAIVNAVYHRGYESEFNSPTKVNIRPHCLEIISYPGPHPSLTQDKFIKGSIIPPVQARNRRIGEFLRQLHWAEARGTGVETIFRTMEKNNNPTPKFDFDSTYFRVTLPAHPKFTTIMLMKDVEELEASGNRIEASEILQKAFENDPKIINQALMQKFISLCDYNCEHPAVKEFEAYIEIATKERCILLKQLHKWLENEEEARGNISYGVSLVKKLIKFEASAEDLFPVTSLVRKLYTERTVDTRKPILKSNQSAHQLLEAYGQSLLSEDGTLAYDFGSIKYQIYMLQMKEQRRRSPAIMTYLIDARNLLQKSVSMSSKKEDPKSYAKKQRQLGYVFYQLSLCKKATVSDYKNCYKLAQEADPNIHIISFFTDRTSNSTT